MYEKKKKEKRKIWTVSTVCNNTAYVTAQYLINNYEIILNMKYQGTVHFNTNNLNKQIKKGGKFAN